MFYVYILKSSKNDSYYIGSTSNLKRRVEMHDKGLAKYTKRYTPWKLVYKEKYLNLNEARRREKQMKSWKKRSQIENLLKNSKI